MTSLRLRVGTAKGLYTLGRDGECQAHDFPDRSVGALCRSGDRLWALVDGSEIWSARDGARWRRVARWQSPRGHCLLPAPGGLVVGAAGAVLLRLRGRRLREVDSFRRVEGRDEWYTPWGAAADVRSLSRGTSGVYVNVHVGGVVRSIDGGRSWKPTVDIDADVHQVLAHPRRAGWVCAASARGLGVSLDGGGSWGFESRGLHARYQRAVAFTRDRILVSTSVSESGRQAAVYWRALDSSGFHRCERGLPLYFADNVNTHCLIARGRRAVIGTADGRIFHSTDQGDSWTEIHSDLPVVRCLAFAA